MYNKLKYILNGRPYDTSTDDNYTPKANCRKHGHIFSFTHSIRSKRCKCGETR